MNKNRTSKTNRLSEIKNKNPEKKELSKEQISAKKRANTGKNGESLFKSKINLNKYHVIDKHPTFEKFLSPVQVNFPELIIYMSLIRESYNIAIPEYPFERTDKFFAADFMLIEKHKKTSINEELAKENAILEEKISKMKDKITNKPDMKIEKRFKLLKEIFPKPIEIDGIKFISAKNIKKIKFNDYQFHERMNNFDFDFSVKFAMQRENKELYSYFKLVDNSSFSMVVDYRSFDFNKGVSPNFEMKYDENVIIGKTSKQVLQLFKIKKEDKKRSNFTPEELDLIEASKQCRLSIFSVQNELEQLLMLSEKQKSVLFYIMTMNYQVFKQDFVFEDDFSKLC